MQIIIFGDSIAYGAYGVDGGWVARLRHYIDEKINLPDNETYYHELYNLSIPGEYSGGVLARFDAEVATRLRKTKDAVIIFAIGTNDSYTLLESNTHKTTIEEYEANMRALVDKTRALNARIIFVGSLLADDARTNPCPWDVWKAFITKDIRRYDAIIQSLANELSLEYIDVATPFIAAGGTALLDDGIHPTSDGHRVIYETVRDALVAKNLI